MRAKRKTKKFDPTKIVLSMKFMSLDCTMRSETLLYKNAPDRRGISDATTPSFENLKNGVPERVLKGGKKSLWDPIS